MSTRERLNICKGCATKKEMSMWTNSVLITLQICLFVKWINKICVSTYVRHTVLHVLFALL